MSGHGGAEARGVGPGRHHPIRRTGQSSSEHLRTSARMRSDLRSHAAAARRSERFRAAAAHPPLDPDVAVIFRSSAGLQARDKVVLFIKRTWISIRIMQSLP